MIAMIAGRAFVGPTLNRTEVWIQQMINFTIDIFQGGQKLKEWNWILRPLVQWFIPEMRRIREHHVKAARFLEPSIRARLAEEATEGYQKKNDAIQWLMDRSRKAKGTIDPREIAYYQLLFSFAAIHTTNGAALHMLYDLAARPEYVEPLREEVKQAWDESGGHPDRSTVMKLEKLDSFMKESQRLNPPGMGKLTGYHALV
jgi:cytochrome P450